MFAATVIHTIRRGRPGRNGEGGGGPCITERTGSILQAFYGERGRFFTGLLLHLYGAPLTTNQNVQLFRKNKPLPATTRNKIGGNMQPPTYPTPPLVYDIKNEKQKSIRTYQTNIYRYLYI